MKNILEDFLDALEVNYTKQFAITLYQEHPHKYNMFGLKKMLDVYGVKTLGVRVESTELLSLTYPCIIHTHNDFIIGLDCKNGMITYLQHGKKTTVSHDVLERIWTGNALVVEETTDAIEPDYKKHRQNDLISNIKKYSIPIMLILVVIVGISSNLWYFEIFDILRLVLAVAGIFFCVMLMEKQLYGNSRYGDQICSLLNHADCNSILDGDMAKVFDISWSEIGLGYFIAYILLLTIYPVSNSVVSTINWIAMLYGIWSIYYQWHVAKNWCVLCVIVQVIIWTMGIAAGISCLTAPFIFTPFSILLSCVIFTISILTVHHHALFHMSEKERIRVIQQYRAIKANSDIAKVLIEKREFYETTLNDSSIIFGNPNAKMRVTILSNPHCNPCARMHEQVDRLLRISENKICIQYIFSSFNKQLEDSSRYLIAFYLNNELHETWNAYTKWYIKDKYNYEFIEELYEKMIHTESVENEMQKHHKWRERTGLVATPTILINGYKCPTEYFLEDLPMLAEFNIE